MKDSTNSVDIACELSMAADTLEAINAVLLEHCCRGIKRETAQIMALVQTALLATASDLRRFAEADPTIQEE